MQPNERERSSPLLPNLTRESTARSRAFNSFRLYSKQKNAAILLYRRSNREKRYRSLTRARFQCTCHVNGRYRGRLVTRIRRYASNLEALTRSISHPASQVRGESPGFANYELPQVLPRSPTIARPARIARPTRTNHEF